LGAFGVGLAVADLSPATVRPRGNHRTIFSRSFAPAVVPAAGLRARGVVAHVVRVDAQRCKGYRIRAGIY